MRFLPIVVSALHGAARRTLEKLHPPLFLALFARQAQWELCCDLHHHPKSLILLCEVTKASVLALASLPRWPWPVCSALWSTPCTDMVTLLLCHLCPHAVVHEATCCTATSWGDTSSWLHQPLCVSCEVALPKLLETTLAEEGRLLQCPQLSQRLHLPLTGLTHCGGGDVSPDIPYGSRVAGCKFQMKSFSWGVRRFTANFTVWERLKRNKRELPCQLTASCHHLCYGRWGTQSSCEVRRRMMN